MSEQETIKLLDLLNRISTLLADSVKHSELSRKASAGAELKEREWVDAVSTLDGLGEQISLMVKKYDEEHTGLELADFRRQVNEFVAAAIEQKKAVLAKVAQAEKKELEQSAASERVAATKSLEAFFMQNTLPVSSKTVFVKFDGSSYEARAKYRCPQELEFEFLLDASASREFRSPLMFSQFARDVRVPVRMSKSWLKREGVADFARLDKYILASAEVTPITTTVVLEPPEETSSVTFVLSTLEGNQTLTAEYRQGEQSSEITSEPALNKFLKRDVIIDSLISMRKLVCSLEGHKIKLTKLSVAGENLIEDGDYSAILITISRAISEGFKEALKKVGGDATLSAAAEQVRAKLESLGEQGKAALEIMGLDVSTKTEV